MNRSSFSRALSNFAIANLLLILAAGSLPTLAASSGRGHAAEITVSGTGEDGGKPFLKLNGEPVLTGRTFFSQSSLETPESVSAVVNLPGLGRVSLSPGTRLSLGFTETEITGRLEAGIIRVHSAAGVQVKIETPDNRLTNDPAAAGSFTVDLTSGTTQAVAASGSVFMNGAPVAKAQTTGGSPSIWIPVAVYSAIVGTAVAVVFLNRSDDDDRAEDAVVSLIR